MHTHLASTSLLCLILVTPASAQTAVGTGVGVSNAEANSAAGAVAVNRGNGSSNSSLVVNNPASTTSTSTQNINTRASGSTSVKTVPSMVAPGLAAAGLETCLGSASGTVSALGWGIGGGSTYVDEGCQARLDSRTLFSYGLKSAAVARICQRANVWNSMPDVCQRYWPAGVPYPYGVIVIGAAGGPAPIVMSANAGVIRVVDGRDGVEKDCLKYDSAKLKCWHWSGEQPIRRQHVASVNPTKSIAPAKPKASATPLAAESAVANSSAVQAIEAVTSGSPKKED